MLVEGRLTNVITGAVVPASGFVYAAPSGALGASVSITLANPLTPDVPIGENLKFEIGIGAGTPLRFSFVPIISQGKIAGRSARYSWVSGKPVGRPGDTLQASALDALADRWQLAPARPVIMIDPERVEEASVEITEADAVKDYPSNAPILPVIEPIEGLSLWTVLERAYTNKAPNLRAGTSRQRYADSLGVGTGAGFSRVITNLPNFPVDRAEFSITGGWHEGAAGLIRIFEPVAYEDNNILYIWDTSKGLPAGVVPKSLPMSCYAELEESTAPADIVNAILLQYLTKEAGGAVSIEGAIPGRRVIHETPQTGGTPNQPGYWRQEIDREIEEWKDLGTGAVVLTKDIETITTNYAFNVSLNREEVTSRQTLRVTYQGDLKVGHTLTVESRYPNPSVEGNPLTELAPVYFEEYRAEWTADLNNPGQSTLRRTIKETRGTVLVEEENEIREGETETRKAYTPILDATRGNGIILDVPEQEERDVTQYTQDRDIETRIEFFTDTGTGQAQVEISRIDLLKGVAYPPVIESRPGSRSTATGRSAPRVSARQITERIIDEDSVKKYGLRKAFSLNVGWLGATEGRKLALQTLRRKANPRRSVSVTLPGLDLSLRRGSILRAATRSGAWVLFIVTGFTITGQKLGTRDQRIFMALEGLEVV